MPERIGVTEERQVSGVPLGALAQWMDSEGLGTGAPLEQVMPIGGGTQNVLLRFDRAGRSYVLRRPPPHLRDNSNETMRREARLLAALAGSAVPHPGLIAACGDPDVIGAAFYLMEPVAGFNAVSAMPPLHAGSPDVRRRMGLSMVEGIAALGALDYHSCGLESFGKPEGFLTRQVPRWQAQLESYAQFAGWTGAGEIPVSRPWQPGWKPIAPPASRRAFSTATIISPMSCSPTRAGSWPPLLIGNWRHWVIHCSIWAG